MITRTPKYYDKFKCTASECKDNCCCGGWLIELDEATAEYYRTLEGEFGEKLKSSLMTDEDGDICFKLTDNRCPHLADNGLCSVCCELGEEHMGVVCKEFPRYTISFSNVTEKGIGLACEEAARIILSDDGFLLTESGECFESQQTDIAKDEQDWQIAEDFEEEEDTGWIEEMLSARNEIFAILSDRTKTVFQRMAEILQFSYDFQEQINGEDGGKRKSQEDFTEEFDVNGNFDIKGNFELLTDIFDNLELLNDKWQDVSVLIREQLFEGTDKEAFADALHMSANDIGGRVFENLMNYFVFRYFMKAVWDYNPFDKIRFAVCACIIIWEMFTAAQLKKGEALTDWDMIQLVKIFSRQVEYSEENVEAVCEEFLFGDDFDVDRLIAMVLV